MTSTAGARGRRFRVRTSVRNRLVLLFFAITAAAVGFIYLYVVPQLRSSLTAERLDALEDAAAEQRRGFDRLIADTPGDRAITDAIDDVARQSGARVTVLGVRGDEPAFVIGDSSAERSAVEAAYPAAQEALRTGAASPAIERVGATRIGEVAFPVESDGEPVWAVVLSTDLEPVDETVSLVRRQIVIAGVIALALALAAGWLAAREHAARLRRLERAAFQIAGGDFTRPIRVDRRDEVGEIAVALDEMRERLAQLDNARKEFIANASHELRTPIFSLGGFIELLDEEDPDPEQRAEFVRMMRGQINRLTKLTADLLDLSKLDSGAMGIELREIDAAPLMRRIAADFGPAAERHGSRISVRAPDGALVIADPERLEQVLRILIDNALSHTPQKTPVLVSADRGPHGPRLRVSDEGPGIPSRMRSRVFERFFVGDDAGGSGLGLAIASELCRRMDGRLELRSERRRTTFEILLPAAPVAAEATR
ncbi:HAMP domain-containing histidine kinase [Thermoleophilia bacterium SCSIO 60948]|nr:HAMP domain-containing histidine kinase [Thermoleophilia bacterium SCSIO 60948]